MDPDILRRKLESLALCVTRIESKTPADADLLASDLDAQDIIVLNLERAVQLCVDLATHLLPDFSIPAPETMAGALLALGKVQVLDRVLAERLARAVSFRNLAVHEYENLDWSVVYTIITTRLDDFRLFAAALQAYSRAKA
ncbi:MAG: DUF86 domain-containing protein [Spirochaetes bacterium]|nr:DUF86 domain-containing protein [Spirochaetota bacterium]